MNQLKKVLAIVIVIGVSLYGYYENNNATSIPARESTGSTHQSLQHAFEKRLSDLQVTGAGTVIRILPDDNKGSRHQKFLLQVSSNQTLLISHNIDLAPRIQSIRKGDTVEFNGEYEWNAKGGVVHWTHQDPNGRHVDGWLKHNGQRYQ